MWYKYALTFLTDCSTNPCIHGRCIGLPKYNTYKCACDKGYTGRNCTQGKLFPNQVMFLSFNSSTTVVPCRAGTANPSGAPEFPLPGFLVAFVLIDLKNVVFFGFFLKPFGIPKGQIGDICKIGHKLKIKKEQHEPLIRRK